MRAFCLAVLFAACSGPAPLAPAGTPIPAAADSPPAFRVIAAGGTGIMILDPARGEARVASPIRGRVASRHPAPGGAVSAAVVEAGDSLILGLARVASGSFERIHAAAAPVVYTVAWSPDTSRMAFGYYRPVMRDFREAMGPGDILEYDVDEGALRPVGCTASRAVLAWLDRSRLLVRDSDHLYTVDPRGCRTLTTVDARRMHSLTASPDGAHVAYVHRELEYDRASRSYVPDSTFMMAAPDGSGSRVVVSFRYHPARFRWRPDGSELAYDVMGPDGPGHRRISVFDVSTGTNAWLHPPETGGPSESDAMFSPDGSAILFTTTTTGAPGSLAVRIAGEPFVRPLEGSQGARALFWAGTSTVVARLPSGVIRVYPLAAEPVDLPAGLDPILVAPAGLDPIVVAPAGRQFPNAP